MLENLKELIALNETSAEDVIAPVRTSEDDRIDSITDGKGPVQAPRRGRPPKVKVEEPVDAA